MIPHIDRISMRRIYFKYDYTQIWRVMMTSVFFEEDTPVDLVSNFEEGRLSYIADIAQQLSVLAMGGQQANLVKLLALAEQEARECIERLYEQRDVSIPE